MGSVVPSDVHLNQFLSGFSTAYVPRGLIADQIFPGVRVDRQSGNYAVILRDNWLRRPQSDRSPGEGPKEVSYTVASDTYYAKNYALGTVVWYETQDNADQPFAPLLDSTRYLRDALGLDYEKRCADLLATSCGSELTTPFAWSNYAQSDPLFDLRIARYAVHDGTGRYPNVAVIGQKTVDYLQYHPEIIKYANEGAAVGGIATLERLARVMRVDRVLVGETVLNTAEEGKLPNTFIDVWSTHCYLLYVDASPGLTGTPTFGAAFQWRGPKTGRGGAPGNFAILSKEDAHKSLTQLYCSYYSDEKIIAPSLGFKILTGVV